MKNDPKLLFAILLLIGLVVCLLVLSVGRSGHVDRLQQQIQKLEIKINQLPPLRDGEPGHTPILGVDYTVKDGRDGRDATQYPAPKDGKDGTNAVSTTIIKEVPVPGPSAYDLAVQQGFVGTLDQWLDSLHGTPGAPAREKIRDCQNGRWVEKYDSDAFWQQTNIKCEVSDE